MNSTSGTRVYRRYAELDLPRALVVKYDLADPDGSFASIPEDIRSTMVVTPDRSGDYVVVEWQEPSGESKEALYRQWFECQLSCDGIDSVSRVPLKRFDVIQFARCLQ